MVAVYRRSDRAGLPASETGEGDQTAGTGKTPRSEGQDFTRKYAFWLREAFNPATGHGRNCRIWRPTYTIFNEAMLKAGGEESR